MLRILCMVASACWFLTFSALAQPSAESSGIADLAYSVQPGKSLYFTGTYQGKSVNLIRNGRIGTGKWTIYTGTAMDRVRLTLDDRKGLQEILALDNGHRMTLNPVGKERIEYRLYGPDRRFIIGSVLYQNNKRWQLGVMKSEAFAGYSALSDISDVTEKFGAQSALPFATLAGWLQSGWQHFDLIPSAVAQEGDNLIRDYFGEKAQGARDFFSAPGHEMYKASLVGAVAVTAKLVATGGSVAVGSAVAAATPLLLAVGGGILLGQLALKVSDWVQAAHLDGSVSARDVFNRLVRPSRYDVAVSADPEALSTESTLTAASADFRKLVALADQSDKQDKLDLRNALDRAGQCKSMQCANEALADASKFARGSGDRMLVFKARESADVRVGLLLADEKMRQANNTRAEQRKQEVAQAAQASEVDQAIQAAIMGVLVDTAASLLSGRVREATPRAPLQKAGTAPPTTSTNKSAAVPARPWRCLDEHSVAWCNGAR